MNRISISDIICILSIYSLQVFLDWSLYIAMPVYAVLSAIAAIVSIILPIETNGKSLKQVSIKVARLHDNHFIMPQSPVTRGYLYEFMTGSFPSPQLSSHIVWQQ